MNNIDATRAALVKAEADMAQASIDSDECLVIGDMKEYKRVECIQNHLYTQIQQLKAALNQEA